MGGFGGGPAAEEDVEADAEVDQRDEAQALVNRAVVGLQDDLDVEFGCAVEVDGLGNWPKDRVGRVRPDAAAKHLAHQWSDAGCRLVVDADEDVTGSDAGSMAG